jgi:hypothetical protein
MKTKDFVLLTEQTHIDMFIAFFTKLVNYNSLKKAISSELSFSGDKKVGTVSLNEDSASS